MSIIQAKDKFFDPFAAHATSSILSPVVKRDLQGVGKNDTSLLVDGFVGNYTVRDGKPVFLGVVSDSYAIVQMRDIVRQAEDAMRQFFTFEQLRTIEVKDVSGFRGAVVERRYTIKAFEEALQYGNTTAKTLEVGTTVAAQLRLRTGYDGGTSTSLSNGLLDLVCTNGMVAMKSIEAISKRHTKGGADMDVYRTWLEQSLPEFANKVDTIREWAQTEVKWSDVEEAVRELPGVSERKADNLLNRIQREVRDRGLNAYAIVSGFTYYSSHNSEEFPVRNTGNDNVLTTLTDREVEVARWLNSPVFQDLLAA
jgi:hypothetical protein